MDTLKLQADHQGEHTGKTYKLVYLADLDRVPLDRLDQLFHELKTGLVGLHAYRESMRAAADRMGIALPVEFVRLYEPEKGLDWRDDGKGEIDLHIPDGTGGGR